MVRRIHRHPRINLLREESDGDEQERQNGEHRVGEILTGTPDGNRPTRIEQVMHHDKKQRSRAEAQDEHERDEIGEQEIHTAPFVAHSQAEQSDEKPTDQQLHRQIAPLGQIQRQGHRRVVVIRM